MKRILSALAAIVTILPFVCVQNAKAVSFPLKTTLNSESAIMINLDADTIIHEKNADTKQLPGPLVNIMTAVVCLENCQNLSEEVTIDESVYDYLYNIEYTDDLRFADILDGDILTVTDLLYAMMLTSSVEASETLAYHISGGNTAEFVKMMNDKAAEIGLQSTNFTNPTGMYDANQYTTARDMATLTKYALTVPMFEKIATTYEYNPTVPNIERHPNHDTWIWNHSNSMMDPEGNDYYAGAKGIKTGNLELGGRNIVAMASRDGNNYLAVLLKSPLSDEEGNNAFYHLVDAKTLFNWAFSHFSYQVILADTAEVGELQVKLAEGNDYVLARPKEDFTILWYDEVDTSVIDKSRITWYKDTLEAPVEKGELLGELSIVYSGEVLGKVEVVAVSGVKRSVSKYNIYVAKLFPKSRWFNKAILISTLLCAIYIMVCIYSFIVFKSKAKPLKPIYAVPKVEKKKKSKK